jgi:hypothetical protein
VRAPRMTATCRGRAGRQPRLRARREPLRDHRSQQHRHPHRRTNPRPPHQRRRPW